MQICIQTKLLTFVSVIRWVTCVGWPNKVILWQRQASSKLMYTHEHDYHCYELQCVHPCH